MLKLEHARLYLMFTAINVQEKALVMFTVTLVSEITQVTASSSYHHHRRRRRQFFNVA